jgi:hypothetical protein
MVAQAYEEVLTHFGIHSFLYSFKMHVPGTVLVAENTGYTATTTRTRLSLQSSWSSFGESSDNMAS